MKNIQTVIRGFNFVSGSTDKDLFVKGIHVASLFSGAVTQNALSEEQLNKIASESIPLTDGRVNWEWAVGKLVPEHKMHLYV